jgi:hypothetical protein
VSVPYLTYLDTYPANVTMSYLMRLPNALEMSPAAALGVDCRQRLAPRRRQRTFLSRRSRAQRPMRMRPHGLCPLWLILFADMPTGPFAWYFDCR